MSAEPEQKSGNQSRSSEIVSWRVSIHEKTCIVFAATKAKAQWLATKSYWEAYTRTGWPRAVASRAEYDQSRLRFEPPRAWCEEYVRDCLNVVTPANAALSEVADKTRSD